MSTESGRLAALCGIAGPVAFVGAWALAGVLADPYDPVRQAISQLARVGAETRPLMTAGLVAFGVLLPLWALHLSRVLPARGLRTAVVVAGLATLAVAALPLGGNDAAHAVAAGIGYVAMAATPLLAARALTGRARTASVAVGVVSAVLLVGSVLVADVSGALQRSGLGVVDAWHVVVATWVLGRGR